MTNEEIKIIDQFKINDSHSKIRGIVSMFDENGNLIFTKENMIVESGRKAIVTKLFNAGEFKIVGAILGNSASMTTADATIEKSFGTYTKVTDKESLSLDEDNSSDLIKCYTIKFKPEEKTLVSCLGLLVNDTLFSRVVFPTYTCSSNQTVTFKYYLYF